MAWSKVEIHKSALRCRRLTKANLLPDALVGRVVNQRCVPLPLVSGVGLGRLWSCVRLAVPARGFMNKGGKPRTRTHLPHPGAMAHLGLLHRIKSAVNAMLAGKKTTNGMEGGIQSPSSSSSHSSGFSLQTGLHQLKVGRLSKLRRRTRLGQE